jgi:hypothetical protein
MIRGIRIGPIDESVEFLNCFPNGHFGTGFAVKLFPDLEVVGDGLLFVLFAVEVFDVGAGFVFQVGRVYVLRL